MDKRSQAPQGENLRIMEMASVYTQFINDSKKKANKLLFEEQQESFLGTIEVNMRGD